METRSNTLSDFVEIRDAINQILIDKPDDFVVIGCSCGTMNNEDRRQSPYPILGFRFQMAFVSKEEADESDLKRQIKPLEAKVLIPSIDPNHILAGINLIVVNNEITGSSDPSLVYIASESTSSLTFRAGRTEYFLGIQVDSVTAEQYDQIHRKPLNSETIQDILKANLGDDPKIVSVHETN